MKDVSLRAGSLVGWCLLIAGLVLVGLTTASAKPAKLLDIADTVAANPILTKFSTCIQASEMATFLSSRGPFTVFVPTDSAFSQMPPGTLDALLRPENKARLQHIVLFHLVNGKKYSAKDLMTATMLLSCEGNPLAIKKTKLGTQLVQKAKIIHADIRCLNGIIHEIDTVLSPPESALPPLVTAPPPPPLQPVPTVTAPTNAPPGDPATPTLDPNTIPVAPVAPSGTNGVVVPLGPN